MPTNFQPPSVRSINLDEYTKALAHFGYTKSGRNVAQSLSPADVSTLINIANLDPSLAKAPNVKAQTLNLFRDLQALLNLEQNAQQKYLEFQKKQQSAQNSSTSSNSRKPPKQDKYFQVLKEQSESERDFQHQRDIINDAIKGRIVAISSVENTSEGQQFSMSSDSKLYTSLQSPVLPGLGRSGDFMPVNSTPFEVASSATEGFFAYRKRITKGPDGSSAKDAKGNYILEADRSKTVFVSGYNKPVSLGESLRLKVRLNGQKVLNGKSYTEYIFVEGA